MEGETRLTKKFQNHWLAAAVMRPYARVRLLKISEQYTQGTGPTEKQYGTTKR